MSYYATRGIKIDKKNKRITVTCADSSLRPLQFLKTEYMPEEENFKGKLENLIISVDEGNFHLYKGANKFVALAVSNMQKWRSCLSKSAYSLGVYFNDMSIYTKVEHTLAEATVQYLYNEISFTQVQEKIQALNHFIADWEKDKKSEWSGKFLSIACAGMSNVFPGYVILIPRNENNLIIAPETDYHTGKLNLGREICLGKDTEKYFHYLAFSGINKKPDDVEEFENIMSKISDLPINILPYKDFPYIKLGFRKIA